MNIYVANISFKATEDQLKELFEEFGEVSSVRVVTDRNTGRSKGFGFIEMTNDNEAREAINDLNGAEFMERNLVVNEARPRPEGGERAPRSGGFQGQRRNNY
jgi:RNA recognition motif-containing protein